ncbi:putative pancreatic secretory proteinase inhibitor [Brachyhypopomus gauderio]|uniref:putative pancreatic secretory proteinase inhibitor n=1 Tax=Brachyhypopomus gauderio TaxID=698409 RepID=UPI0040424379
MRAVFLIFFVVFSVGADGKSSSLYQKPACGDLGLSSVCPLNYSPICGSDGITYPNECALCLNREQSNSDILIVKEGSC